MFSIVEKSAPTSPSTSGRYKRVHDFKQRAKSLSDRCEQIKLNRTIAATLFVWSRCLFNRFVGRMSCSEIDFAPGGGAKICGGIFMRSILSLMMRGNFGKSLKGAHHYSVACITGT
jgi:hypothetical protein